MRSSFWGETFSELGENAKTRVYGFGQDLGNRSVRFHIGNIQVYNCELMIPALHFPHKILRMSWN